MRLENASVAIVGLGLMGGSLGMSLRGSCRHVVGIVRRPETAQHALDMGVVEAVSCDLEAVIAADLVVLATPIRHILAIIPEVASIMRPGTLLMDVGSTKTQVVEAMNALPKGIAAVGGHPMCGKETGGLESADPNLFRGATFALTPTARTTSDAMLLAREMVEATGAIPIVLDAERHDRLVGITSHLPYLLAASLMHTEIEASAGDDVTDRLAASGFQTARSRRKSSSPCRPPR